MLKLFAVLLGGRAPGARIELHDVVFTVGTSLEARYPYLIHKWFGDVKRLHVDSSAELTVVDGYQVFIQSEPPPAERKQPSLYFVNFGGYHPGVFGEMHEMSFYVGHDKKEIVAKAKRDLCVDDFQQHCDDSHEIAVDDLLEINQVEQYYIHLEPTMAPNDIIIESSYRRLDVPKTVEMAENLKELA